MHIFARRLMSYAPLLLLPLPTHFSTAQDKNAPWKGADIDRIVHQLESPSRPVFRERRRLAALLSAPKGSVIADVGAGSGFMIEFFAAQVGSAGKVYAVEVNPGLVAHLEKRAHSAGWQNVEVVLTRTDSLDLPTNSLDRVFLCLTYRFMEQPRSSMAGVRKALRSKGELVIVEADDAELGGRQKLTDDLANDGFDLVRQEPSPFLPPDYFVLRFRKKV